MLEYGRYGLYGTTGIMRRLRSVAGKRNRFWPEEIPRWFGLSLVLIYLGGLGAVAYFAVTTTRNEVSAHVDRLTLLAVRSLAVRLGHLSPPPPPESDPAARKAFQTALNDFAAQVPVRVLRVVDSSGRVVASTQITDVNRIIPDDSTEIPVVHPDAPDVPYFGARDALVYRFRIPISSKAGLYLQAELPIMPVSSGFLGRHSTILLVTLVCLGILFVLYRRLREQLRGLSRIGACLASQSERIETDLASLRITDVLDNVTLSWNRLVDSAQNWLEAVERSAAAEELARVLQRTTGGELADALHALPDGLLLITNEVRFAYLNSALARMLGWNMEEAKHWTLPEAKAEGLGAEALSVLRGALRPDGTYEPRDQLLKLAEGTGQDHSWYRVQVVPIRRNPGQGGCFLLLRDVSQQVRADKAREDFVSQVTHELRTPLTNIRAYAETLASGMFDDPKVITDCYNVITKETRRLSRLIEDILSVSQLEVGTIELQLDSVDVKALLTDAVRDVRGLADEKDIDLQLVLPPKLENIRADRDKLAVVLNNLLGNAIKYTPRGGNVICGCQARNDAVVVTVKDNGIGIDPADLARIFDKFQRGKDPEVLNEPGTGIGLYTAREIVRRHGGEIDLMSEKGAGSTFLVRLPHRAGRASALSTADLQGRRGRDPADAREGRGI
jgi:PAS domain S-box-containing protein